MGVKTNRTPTLEIEEFATGILLIHKIFDSAKLRVSAPITPQPLQRLINSGCSITRKVPSQRTSRERARSGSYRHPISDSEICDAVEEGEE